MSESGVLFAETRAALACEEVAFRCWRFAAWLGRSAHGVWLQEDVWAAWGGASSLYRRWAGWGDAIHWVAAWPML